MISEEVTEAYARKWGHGLAIREYIQSSLIYAEKPKTLGSGALPHGTGSRAAAEQIGVGSGKKKPSRRLFTVRPAVAAADTDEHPSEESGDVCPPGDAVCPAHDSGQELQ